MSLTFPAVKTPQPNTTHLRFGHKSPADEVQPPVTAQPAVPVTPALVTPEIVAPEVKVDSLDAAAALKADSPVNSEVFEAKAPSGRKLSLRKWWAKGTEASDLPKKGPAILIVPGYGGRTGWGAPLAAKVLERHPLMYGVNISALEADLTKRTPLPSGKDLVNEIKDTVDWIHQTHGDSVYIVSTSLGALASTHAVADHPENVAGLVLIAPAYRGHPSFISPMFYIKSFVRKGLEALRIMKPKEISLKNMEGPADPKGMPANIKPAKQEKFVLGTGLILSLLRLAYSGIYGKIRRIQVPTMVVVPGKDKMCSPDAMRKAFETLGSQDKRLAEYPTGRHNIVREAEMDSLSTEISDWLDQNATGTFR